MSLSYRARAPFPPLASRVQQGQALLQKGECDDALRIADDVLAMDAGFAEAGLLRAAACYALRRFGEARDAYRSLLALFPEFNQMRLNMAHACMELDDIEEARALLLDAIAQNPDFAVAHASLGSLCMRMDRHDLAEAPLRRALELDPTIVSARQNLAAILTLRNDPEAAVQRDTAYRQQQIFIERSPAPRSTALILMNAASGNIPYQYLLPLSRYNRTLWYLAYTPLGQDQHLPPYDFVFNAVGDPDAAPQAQLAVERFLPHCDRPVINRPDAIARTLRSQAAELLGSIENVIIPRTVRISACGAGLAQILGASAMAYPLILRPVGKHGGQGVRLLSSEKEMNQTPICLEAAYATEFLDYRSADGWYRKYRVIFVDRQPYPYHLAIGDRWLLHYQTALMTQEPGFRKEEAAFLGDMAATLGSKAMAALRAIGERLDLDYAGIDFSLTPQGCIVFFEANATMLVHPEKDPACADKNRAAMVIIEAMAQMIVRKLAG